MVEKIRDAIVIHGPGRSGTTLLNQILSLHPALAWISGYVNRFPSLPALAILNRVVEVPLIERLTRAHRYWPRPAEAYNFWKYYFANFSATVVRERMEKDDRYQACIAAIRNIMR